MAVAAVLARTAATRSVSPLPGQARSRMASFVQTELGKGKLEALSVPVPSHDEQERIAESFELLADRVRSLTTRQRTASREAGALWQAALNRAFGSSS